MYLIYYITIYVTCKCNVNSYEKASLEMSKKNILYSIKFFLFIILYENLMVFGEISDVETIIDNNLAFQQYTYQDSSSAITIVQSKYSRSCDYPPSAWIFIDLKYYYKIEEICLLKKFIGKKK